MLVDGLDVGTQVEEAANTCDDGGEKFDVGKTDSDAKTLTLGEMLNFDGADGAFDLDGAVIDSVLDDFDAGNGARLEISEHGVPIVGRTVAQAKSGRGVGVTDGSLASDGGGRAVKKIVKG